MAFATLGGTGMLICIRYAGQDVHPLEIGFLRSLFALPLLLPWYLPRQGWRLPAAHWRWQVARGIALAATMLGYFAAVTLLPLVVVIAFNLTSPLFTTLGAAVFLKEKVGRRWIAILTGFVGAVLIAAPAPFAPDLSPLGLLLAVATALFGATELLLLKILAGRCATWTNVVWATIAMTAVSALPATLVWTPPAPETLLWLAGLALAATGSQAAVTRAFYWADVAPVMAANFLQLVLAALTGWLLFDETVGPTTALGAVLILGANVFMVQARHRP